MSTKPMWTTDGDPEPVDVEQAGLRRAKALELVDVLIAEGGAIERRCRDHPCEWCGTSTVAVGAGCCIEPVLVFPIPVEKETTT